MGARATLVLLGAFIIAIAPLVGAATADNPNIDDATGEGDPRTDGLTDLPGSLDVDNAWIQPETQSVDFVIQVRDLTVPHTHTVPTGFDFDEIRYEFQFDLVPAVFEGHSFCDGTTRGFVYAQTTAGAHASMEAYAGCVESDGFRLAGVGGNCNGDHVTADGSDRTITVSLPRGCGTTGLFLEPGTTLENPTVEVYRSSLGFRAGETFDEAGPGSPTTV